MPAKGTPLTPIRLTDEDRAKIEVIRGRHNLPNLAAVVRFLVDAEAKRLSRRAGVTASSRKPDRGGP